MASSLALLALVRTCIASDLRTERVLRMIMALRAALASLCIRSTCLEAWCCAFRRVYCSGSKAQRRVNGAPFRITNVRANRGSFGVSCMESARATTTRTVLRPVVGSSAIRTWANDEAAFNNPASPAALSLDRTVIRPECSADVATYGRGNLGRN